MSDTQARPGAETIEQVAQAAAAALDGYSEGACHIDHFRIIARALAGAGFLRGVSAAPLPMPGDGCLCTGHCQDYGGYVEHLLQYEPACPEHSEHVWNPRTGIWEHASTHPAPAEQPEQPVLPTQPAPDF